MKSVKIKYKWFKESGQRLDASYHLSDGPITKIKLKNAPYPLTTLSKESKDIFSGNIFKRTYVESEEFGWPYLTGSDMMKADIESGKFISKKHTKQKEKLAIKKGWILITCSGTLGNTVFTNSDFEGRVATHDLIRVVPKKDKLLSGFTYAYLTSKFGNPLLTQSSYGGVVKHIEPHHIQSLPIPVFPDSKQQKINDLVENSATQKTAAIESLNTAINYFEKKIGISNVHLNYQTNSINAISINNHPKRLDAQYQILRTALKNENNTQLEYHKISSLAKDIFVGGRGKRIYVDNGIDFLSSSEMMLYNPKRNCKQVSKRTYGLESMVVSKKDILISRSGTVGNTVLVGDQLKNTAISEHALRLIIDPEKISPNYVFCFLKTKFGMKSMEASSFGSVIITLNEELIGNLDIPILSKDDQNKVSELIENYITKMDESVALENKALDLVENEIEQWQK